MLGWSFSVYADRENKYTSNYGYWESGKWDADDWVHKALADGNAKPLALGGGYPNIYEVASSYVPADKINKPIVEEKVIVEMWDQS